MHSFSSPPCCWRLAALHAGDGRRKPADRPNILFILIDDYGIKDVGIEGSSFYETPHIDALARGGMRFTQGYAACPVCSPSRRVSCWASIRHGTASPTTSARKRAIPLPDTGASNFPCPIMPGTCPRTTCTLAQAFKKAGYATFFAGKWHLGGQGFWPEDCGFDINKGGWSAGSPIGGYYAPWVNPKLPSGPRGQSLTDRLATETISFIEQHHDKPFLAYLAPYAVHGPIQTTRPLWAKYRERRPRQPAPASVSRLTAPCPCVRCRTIPFTPVSSKRRMPPSAGC